MYNYKVKAYLRPVRDKENYNLSVNQKSRRNSPLSTKSPNPTTINNTKAKKYWESKSTIERFNENKFEQSACDYEIKPKTLVQNDKMIKKTPTRSKQSAEKSKSLHKYSGKPTPKHMDINESKFMENIPTENCNTVSDYTKTEQICSDETYHRSKFLQSSYPVSKSFINPASSCLNDDKFEDEFTRVHELDSYLVSLANPKPQSDHISELSKDGEDNYKSKAFHGENHLILRYSIKL